MRYQRSGYPIGAWIINLGGKRRVLESTGSRALPALDRLYVPRVPNPRTWDDYRRELVADAEEKLLRLIGVDTQDRSTSDRIRLDSRVKAVRHRDKAVRLNEAWSVGAVQARYSDDGHWWAHAGVGMGIDDRIAAALSPNTLYPSNTYRSNG